MSRVVLAACAVLLLLAEAHAQSDWKKEWEKTIEAAKKEGQVNVYIGGWETVLESGAFQKAYPEIKVTWTGGRAGEIAQRILAERRAGKFLADVAAKASGRTTMCCTRPRAWIRSSPRSCCRR